MLKFIASLLFSNSGSAERSTPISFDAGSIFLRGLREKISKYNENANYKTRLLFSASLFELNETDIGTLTSEEIKERIDKTKRLINGISTDSSEYDFKELFLQKLTEHGKILLDFFRIKENLPHTVDVLNGAIPVLQQRINELQENINKYSKYSAEANILEQLASLEKSLDTDNLYGGWSGFSLRIADLVRYENGIYRGFFERIVKEIERDLPTSSEMLTLYEYHELSTLLPTLATPVTSLVELQKQRHQFIDNFFFNEGGCATFAQIKGEFSSFEETSQNLKELWKPAAEKILTIVIPEKLKAIQASRETILEKVVVTLKDNTLQQIENYLTSGNAFTKWIRNADNKRVIEHYKTLVAYMDSNAGKQLDANAKLCLISAFIELRKEEVAERHESRRFAQIRDMLGGQSKLYSLLDGKSKRLKAMGFCTDREKNETLIFYRKHLSSLDLECDKRLQNNISLDNPSGFIRGSEQSPAPELTIGPWAKQRIQ